jgi:hypothetical protein
MTEGRRFGMWLGHLGLDIGACLVLGACDLEF